MPLTPLQTKIAKLISVNRKPESHLAGGAAIHAGPNSLRFSMDLDYFHDSDKHVAEAFLADQALLLKKGFQVEVEVQQPGYIRALVSEKTNATKLEWAQDSIWRFLPTQKDELLGYVLSPLDLAINKLLALVGRDEPRDYLDVHFLHQHVLPLGAMCWAACGKDPGFSPGSLFEILQRRGKYQSADFERLNLTKKIDLVQLKTDWLVMLDEARSFLDKAPTDLLGCLFYNTKEKKFVQPKDFSDPNIQPHFGRPHGVLPRFLNE